MRALTALFLLTMTAGTAHAGVLTFGDKDCLGQGCYVSDPTFGATLQGLSAGVVTLATNTFGHGFPFSPDVSDFAGTDQIYVGSVQTAFHDGYSGFPSRLNGPQTFTLDFSPLIPSGQTLTSLTLGIAADDFQNAVFGQPFTAKVNGVVNSALTAQLNALNQTGPEVQFLTIGLSTSVDPGTHLLTLSINQDGDGGDG